MQHNVLFQQRHGFHGTLVVLATTPLVMQPAISLLHQADVISIAHTSPPAPHTVPSANHKVEEFNQTTIKWHVLVLTPQRCTTSHVKRCCEEVKIMAAEEPNWQRRAVP